MNYTDRLIGAANLAESIACMGLDPVLDTIPLGNKEFKKGESRTEVLDFYNSIFQAMAALDIFPGAFKLNKGFYEALSPDPAVGNNILRETISMVRTYFPDIPIILDNKSGDIGKSSANYAKAAFSWDVDVCVVHPYMGTDSVEPYLKYCENGKGVYVLDRTSNSGAKDFQPLEVMNDKDAMCKEIVSRLMSESPQWKPESGIENVLEQMVRQTVEQHSSPLYMQVAKKIVEWSNKYNGTGAVIGATGLPELENIVRFYHKQEQEFYNKHERDIPLLIPGVGGQGGSATEVMQRLKDVGYRLELVRINSSSGITQPWGEAKDASRDWALTVAESLKRLNRDIDYKKAA